MADRGISRSRWSSALVMTIAAGIAPAIVAGCATVPSGSVPRQVVTRGSAVQAYVRPLPPPGPQSQLYTTPVQVVLGFLSASASYAFDPAAARQFLAPALRKHWRPGPVTVVSSLGKPTLLRKVPCRYGLHDIAGETCLPEPGHGSKYDSVTLTAQHLATLSQDGQYQYSSGTSTYTFFVAQRNGVWLITGLPQGGHTLLLTKANFQEVYQPRNLFFFARQEPSVVNGELIPDPVYAPEESADSALNTDVAAGLIKGLLKDQGSWLSDATTTAFPSGTKLLKVTISGQVATVDLGGAAARMSQQRKNFMAAQLLATLASKAYSSPLAHNVVLEINGRIQHTFGVSNLVSPVSTGPLVYQSEVGSVNELHPTTTLMSGGPVGSPQVTALAATDNGPISAAAAGGSSGSPQPVPAIAVAGGNGQGCTVYVPVATPAGLQDDQFHRYPLSVSGSPCTSLSWDRNGYLWAVAGAHIWRLRTQQGHVLRVSNPSNLPSVGKSGPDIIALRMAPDGVRAALLIKTPAGNRIVLAAVFNNVRHHKVSLDAAVPAWTGLKNPTALSWYSAYSLMVLTSNGIWQVPLTGGPGRLLGNAPAGAVSLESDGVTLVVGTKQHSVDMSSNGANSWKPVALGTFPSYPG